MTSQENIRQVLASGNCKVVLVEDDPMLAIIMSAQLESVGIDFCATADGNRALELIKAHHPRLLLLDVSIPGMNGFELIDKIRTDPDLCNLRSISIVVHTSLELSLQDEKRLTLNEKTQFITKSKATEELANVVSTALLESFSL